MGLRKTEIHGLKYSDVDFTKRKITIQRQLGRKITEKNNITPGQFTKQEIPTKTKSSVRELDLPDIIYEAIVEEKAKYIKNRSRRINDKTTPFKDYGYICCSTYGNPRSAYFHNKYFRELLENNNLPYIRFHDLRSTFTTILITNNFSSKAISKILGHAKEIITLDIYTDKKNVLNDVVDPINKFLDTVIVKNEDDEIKDAINTVQDIIINSL